MLNSLVSLHSYLILNGAIAVGYIIARLILGLPFFKNKTSQFQRLRFARYSFFIAAASFFLMPVIITIIPFSYHSNFHLAPIMSVASATFSQNYKIINAQLSQMGSTHVVLSINFILIIIVSIGSGFFVLKYIKNLFALRKIKQNSFCRHKINNTQVLFCPTITIPFCWSFIKSHFIAIPNMFIEKNNDLRLVISHELQHIRQGDTRWLHFLMIIKSFCFWNPFLTLWINWLDELQEFSCDEVIVLRKKTSPAVYAQCLITAASNTVKIFLPHGVLGIHGLSRSILYRRIDMLFNYKNIKKRKPFILFAYVISFFIAISAAYAVNGSSSLTALSAKQVAAIIQQSHLDTNFKITATPEVVSEINNIRGSDQAHSFMRESLQRMKQYQPIIQAALKKEAMPNELLAVPLVESGYEPLDQSKNQFHAAGIWQLIPATAKHFGLIVNKKRDDRLDTVFSTKAALAYLNELHQQFGDWRLAVIAYEYGEQQTSKLIKTVGSRDVWVLARSPFAFKNMKEFISMLDAAVIIMRNPTLIA